MSQCLVPNWNLKQHRQEQVEGEEGSKSSHVHNQHHHPDPAATTLLVPMSNYELAELIWENGQLSMHGLSGLPLPNSQPKPTWSRPRDTLESIVQQATCQYQKSNFIEQHEHDHAINTMSSIVASPGGKRGEDSGDLEMMPASTRKRARSNSDYCGRNFSIGTNILEECDDFPSGCASAGATFCRDNDTTMNTWTSLESGQSLKNSKILEEDSACHCGSEIRDNQDEERDSKAEIGHSNSIRRNRTAAVHNQSERRRRDRINQKMKALQKLVPNASKTDKASMLDEVINYLKQLQAQIQIMNMRSMSQMVMPLAMQQQLQMSMLARMGVGLGMGMGMVNINNMASHTAAPGSFPQLIQPTPVGAPATAPVFVAPSFMMPPLIQAHASAPPKPEPASATTNSNASIALPDPYSAVLTQSVNMDILNNMAALYQQQMSQNNQAMSNPSQPHHGQSD